MKNLLLTLIICASHTLLAQVNIVDNEIVVNVNSQPIDSLLIEAGKMLNYEVQFIGDNSEKDINRSFENFESLAEYALSPNPFLIEKRGQAWSIFSKDTSKLEGQDLTFYYEAKHIATSLLVEKASSMPLEASTLELAEQGAVLVMGNFDQVQKIVDFFDLIDSPLKSVTVELLVVEYLHSDGFKWGINIENGSSGNFGTADYDPSSDGNGLSLSYNVTNLLDNGFQMNLQALIENDVAKIATNPHLTVTNGSNAVINLNTDKYIVLQTASINGLTTNLQELNTGIELNITPRLAADSTIHLEVSSSLSEFVPNTVTGEYTIATNKINTDINIENHETLVIGGLISENYSKLTGRTPFFSRIPILGYLFKGEQKRKEFIETVIYITAYSTDLATPDSNLINTHANFSELEKDQRTINKEQRRKNREDRRLNRRDNQ